ncbi:hypothetical protein Tco_1003596 [Tanacetum coccineum]|uniref:Uncharacterized protein n=1 Tax=Tanacetum coccineum TaxID=301880 RepID=A0ABQ5FB01_9ASTR
MVVARLPERERERGRKRRVRERDLVGWIDRVVRINFGFGWKSSPKKFSGNGATVVAGSGDGGGWPDTLGEREGLGSREVGYGIRDTWVDLEEAVPEITPMTVGEVNTRVTELAELHKHDTQDLYALLEDAQDSRTRISQRVDLLIGDRMTLQETTKLFALREQRRRARQPTPDARVPDHQDASKDADSYI